MSEPIDDVVEYMNEAIFASGSSNHVFASLLETLGFLADDSLAALGWLGTNDTVDHGLDVLRWTDVDVDIRVIKILIAVTGSSIRRALRSDCIRLRRG